MAAASAQRSSRADDALVLPAPAAGAAPVKGGMLAESGLSEACASAVPLPRWADVAPGAGKPKPDGPLEGW